MCATIGISTKTYTTNRLWDVGPRRGRKKPTPQSTLVRAENPKKTYNPNAAGESGEKHTIQAVRAENPEKNPQFNWFCLVVVGWLVVVALSTTHAEAPCGGNELYIEKFSALRARPLSSDGKMRDSKIVQPNI